MSDRPAGALALIGAGVGAGVRTVFRSSTAAATELAAADTLLRTPLPLSRRVSVVGVRGGVGTTSVTAAMAGLLARRRSGLVLGVDAAGGAAGFARGHRPSAEGPPAPDTAADERRVARSLVEATAGLSSGPHGLRLLDVTPARERSAATTEWGDQVAPVARFFDLVLTDWGARPVAGDLAEVAATGHVVVVVARAERHAATEAAGVVEALHQHDPATPIVLALVDVGRTADRMQPLLAQRLTAEVVLVPHDPAWGVARPDHSGRPQLRPGSRLAVTRLTAVVMTAVIATRRRSGRTSVPASAALGSGGSS